MYSRRHLDCHFHYRQLLSGVELHVHHLDVPVYLPFVLVCYFVWVQQLNQELTDDDYPLKLALGIAHLESGNEEAAIRTFEAIYASNALIRDDALYYVAMANLKSGDRASAAEVLQQVRAEFPEYKAAAIDELLSRL